MRDVRLGKQTAEYLVLFDRNGTDQHRLALLVQDFDLPGDGFEFAHFGAINTVSAVFANKFAVWWNFDDIEFVNLVEFLGFGHGSTGHTSQFFVQAEEVLETNGR